VLYLAFAMTHLAVPISAAGFDEALRQIREAVAAGAAMLELRTDYLEALSPSLAAKLLGEIRSTSASRQPAVIVTCRDKSQGGARDYPEELRLDVLCAAVTAGADFIDVEYSSFARQANRKKVSEALSNNPEARLILSAHDFKGSFGDIAGLCGEIERSYPGAVPKLVYNANHINDCFEAFDLLHQGDGERIVFCMGQAGLISRIIAKKLGGFVTFASLDQASATAPGQLTIEQSRELYRYDSIDSDTELYGVIGSPIGHSLSPAIHNACFEHAGMNKLYLPLLVEGGKADFEQFVNSVASRAWLDFRGLSVTIPHKQNALDYVRANGGFIEPLAQRIGAVNTLLLSEHGRIRAYNTDYAGAIDAITGAMNIDRKDLKGLSVAVVGAGGVARAIVAALSDIGADITVYNRTLSKAQALAAEFACGFDGLDGLSRLDAKLLINCTSVGMHPKPDESPAPKECIRKGMVVFDTVYNPAETLLLRQARRAGAKTIDGVSMFVNQAMTQFRLFTGRAGDAELMREIIHDSLFGQVR